MMSKLLSQLSISELYVLAQHRRNFVRFKIGTAHFRMKISKDGKLVTIYDSGNRRINVAHLAFKTIGEAHLAEYIRDNGIDEKEVKKFVRFNT